jgi:Baseplate J-like protein
MAQESKLDRCGCCEVASVEEPVRNAPALPALRYRVGTHATFLQRMVHGLSGVRPDPNNENGSRPLAGLTTRGSDDATIALLDAVSSVADVLTFYQERIANEGFLRTATERRSVLELARAIGYELGPGVAASVYLSFTIEDAPGAPGVCVLPKGMQVQSVPPQDKLPQVFETSAEFTAYAEWNQLKPRLTRPADMAILANGTTNRLVLLGPSGSFSAAALPDLTSKVNKDQIYRLDPAQNIAGDIDALQVEPVYFTEAAAGVAKGDLLLFTGKGDKATQTLVLRVSEVTPDADKKQIVIDLEPLPKPAETKPFSGRVKLIPFISSQSYKFASVKLNTIGFNRDTVASTVLEQTWHERDLQALMGIHGWRRSSLTRAVNTKPPAEPVAIEAGAFAFRERAGFFGHNAPKWASLPNTTPPLPANPYPKGWDKGDKNGTAPQPTLAAPRTIWTDSQGTPNTAEGPHAYLERPVSGLTRAGWLLFTTPELDPAVYSVYDAREASRADYGLSGRATALILADTSGTKLGSTPTGTAFQFRTTTAHVASRRLELAELPIDSPVEDTKAIELDRMVLGLTVGQAIALAGERSDLTGVEAAEIAFLADIIHSEGRTTLVLQEKIKNRYVRSKLSINANVVHATHGETVTEPLGSGDASSSNQRFMLKKPPLTYVSAPTPRGISSSLEVRVNGIRWNEAPSLFELKGNDQSYVVRIDDDARAQVIFGDGQRGARVPSGGANISATYRSGIGPDGEVDEGSLTLLRSMPLGLRGVTNTLAAGGAEGPERLANARRNAPLTVLTFERVVSLSDYEGFARTFPGIGKARGDLLWIDGGEMVHLTVAGATGGTPSDDVVRNLTDAIRDVSDLAQRFKVSSFAQRYFECSARVAVDPRYVPERVLADVENHLRVSFAFEARDFAQSVTAAEVIKLIHEVAGVVAVDIDKLTPYSDTTSVPAAAPAAPFVPAFRARWNNATREFEPAELLLINPVGIDLKEMKK